MTKELKAVTVIRDLLKQVQAEENKLNDYEKLYEAHPENTLYESQFDRSYQEFHSILSQIADELGTLGIEKLTAWQMVRNDLSQIESIISRLETAR